MLRPKTAEEINSEVRALSTYLKKEIMIIDVMPENEYNKGVKATYTQVVELLDEISPKLRG